MRSAVDSAIESFNRWLSSERGFVQAVSVSLLWDLAVVLGWDKNGLVYLFAATELGFFALFTLAIIGRRSAAKVDQALETIDRVVDDVYVTAQTLVQLAQNEMGIQEALVAQTEAIVAALDELRASR